MTERTRTALAPLALALLLSAAASSRAAASNPSRNVQPSRPTVYACLTPRAPVEGCDKHALTDVDSARRAEGIAPLSLPGDFASLSVPERLLALTDIERVDRGLAPAIGLTRRLSAAAHVAALTEADPTGPDGYSWGSNWAGGTRSTVFDDFSWMYDDGFGSQNLACRNPADSGCWGHRDNILAPFSAPIAMGAGIHASSLTELLVAGYAPAEDGGDPVLSPSWQEIATTLPIGVSATRLHLPRAGGTTRLRLWASGETMSVTAALPLAGSASGWTVSPSGCELTAGSGCTLVLSAAARHGRATLALSGPNGRQTVALS